MTRRAFLATLAAAPVAAAIPVPSAPAKRAYHIGRPFFGVPPLQLTDFHREILQAMESMERLRVAINQQVKLNIAIKAHP